MGFFDTILFPFTWVMSWLLSIFHTFFTWLGLSLNSGWTWTLALVLLVITVRTALIPLFVRQIKSQRAMQAMQPEIQKLQAKYKGKNDQLSRQAMVMEQQELFKKHGSSPFSACLPMLVQMPFFFALFSILNNALRAASEGESIGGLSAEEVASFAHSTVFGVSMSETFMNSVNAEETSWNTLILAAIMIVLMSGSMFYMQRMLMSKNMTETAMTGPMAQSQRMMLYVMPLIFAIGGINFPIGVLIYWTATNFWAVGQQFYIIRRNPTPGSQAEKELNERRRAKGLEPIGKEAEEERARAEREAAKPKGQRQQPTKKKRSQRKKQ